MALTEANAAAVERILDQPLQDGLAAAQAWTLDDALRDLAFAAAGGSVTCEPILRRRPVR
jgi:hypothetical protein